MIDQTNTILISYPSGGFGNFIFHILTEFSDLTYKPKDSFFEFSEDGNSHATAKYTNIWFHDPLNYTYKEINTDKKILILCDNGITNDSYSNIRKYFNDALIIRTCITPSTRPIIFNTCVTKAKKSSPIKEIERHVQSSWIDADKNYALRENFKLLYHHWPFNWEPINDKNIINLNLESLILNTADTLINLIQATGGNVINHNQLLKLCDNWKALNQKYFNVYYNWKKIDIALDCEDLLAIDDIVDLHEQGYIDYCIEKKYSVTIPVYDYKDWFKNTKEILYMIAKLKYVQNKITIS